jgi:heme/copper-type cytochrome/quinol oxidase subunit 2
LGGANLKTRFFIFLAAIALLVIIIVAAAASPKAPSTPKPTPTPPGSTPTETPPTTLSFTVKAGAGINTVTVTNQNTGAVITLTIADLPATFNFKKGDTLTFKVTANDGYHFNAWVFNDGTFQSQNPYSIKASASFTMEAHFLMVNP